MIRICFAVFFLSYSSWTAQAQDLNIDHRKNMKYDPERRLQVIDFGTIAPTEEVEKSIYMKPKGSVTIKKMTAEGGFSVVGPSENIKAKQSKPIRIAFDGQCKAGPYTGVITIESDGRIRVQQIGFKVLVEPGVYELLVPEDTLRPNPESPEEVTFTLTNEGTVYVQLLSPTINQLDTKWKLDEGAWNTDEQTLSPNGSVQVTILAPAAKGKDYALEFIAQYCNPKTEQKTYLMPISTR